MPLYTFYPCRRDDTSLVFDAVELADDAAAATHTLSVLREHLSAEFVVVWCGERRVLTRHRMAPELAALLMRAPARSEAGS